MNEIGTALLVGDAGREQLRPHLDNQSKLSNVVVALGVEPDLDVSGRGRSGPRLLRTVDRVRHEIRQALSQLSQLAVGDTPIVGDLDERHIDILPSSIGDVSPPARTAWQPAGL